MKVLIIAALVALAAADRVYQQAYPKTYPVYPSYKSYEYPPQPYSFNYEVKDDYYNNFGHSESSDGKVTTGSYHVALPDGRHQTVTYKADDYGYVADVKYQREAVKYDYKPAYPTYKTPAYPAYKTSSYPAYPTYKPPAYPTY